MNEMIKHRADLAQQTDEQRTARERMALFPARAEVLYIAPDIWVVRPLSLVSPSSLLSSFLPLLRPPFCHSPIPFGFSI